MHDFVTRFAFAASLVVPLVAQESRRVFDAAQVQVGPLEPAFEALFDLDGDAYPDAVAALFGTASGRIGTYRNDGTGRFVPVWSTGIRGWFGENFLVPGDFDGDGRRDDFVVGVANTVQVYCCDGVGPPTVAGPQVAFPGGTLRDLEVEDLDRDGRDDVIALGTDAQTTPATTQLVAFLTTDPAGQPTIHPLVVSGSRSRIRTLHASAGHAVTMLLSTTSGELVPVVFDAVSRAWQASAPIAVERALGDPAAGDVDGDGDQDLVLFGVPLGNGRFQVVRQDAGAFTAEPGAAGGPATGLADVDGDGDLDGVCCGGGGGGPPLPNHRASTFEIAINDGAGRFAPSFRIHGLGARHLAGAADVDGDGDQDLVAGRVVYFADGPLRADPFGHWQPRWFGGEGDLSGPRDGDGDGDADVAVSPYGSHRNLGTRGFVTEVLPGPVAMQYARGLALGDWDADGDVDALLEVSSFGNPPIAPGVWNVRQSAPGHWELGAFALTPDPNRLVPGWSFRSHDSDLDSDGIPDLLVTTEFQVGTSTNVDLTSVYRGSAGGAFTFVRDLDATVKAIADFDGDRLPDLLVARRFAHWALARNLGGLAFGTPTVVLPASVESYHDRPAVGDLDGDGDLDCVLPTPVTIVVCANDGAGNLVPQPRQPSFPDFGGNGQRIVRLCDADGDRKPDLLVYPGRETTFSTTILRGQGDGTFVEHATEVVNPELAADLDGDGAVELVLPSRQTIVAAKPRRSRGEFEQRHASGPGTGGIAMSFGARGPFRADDTIELRVRGGLGGAIGGLLLTERGASVPNLFGAGHGLWLDVSGPTVAVPIVLGGAPGVAGAGTLAVSVPIPLTMLGVELHHQVGVIDAGAPLGLSTSNGLRIRYGS
jgi:hypothetical protein